MVTRQGRSPLYQQIADQLRAQISDGTIRRGSKLPTEAELSAAFGVNRATARQALGVLVNEGLIYVSRPHGYFVHDRKPMYYRPQVEFRPRPTSPEMDRFMTEHSETGRSPHQSIDVGIVEPSDLVADRLHLEVDQPVLARRRVRFLDDEPYYLNDSYYPLNIVEGTEIMQPADIARGANVVLAEHGHQQVRAFDEIYVRMPTPDEVHRLDLAPGVPVACHVNTSITATNTPVRVVVNILPGDRHVIVYERARPDASADHPPS